MTSSYLRYLTMLVALTAACGDDDVATDAGASDAGAVDSGTVDSGTVDSGAVDSGAIDSGAIDSGTVTDGGLPDSSATGDARAEPAPGSVCVVNADCRSEERCECSDGGCACAPGVRGTGQSGVDTCAEPHDCASALCVEGPADGTFYCSDLCMTDDDCAGMLPRCLDVAFVGRICARTPPG